MGAGGGDGDGLVGGLAVGASQRRRRREGARGGRDAQQRLALFAEVGGGQRDGAARFVVEQDGFDDRLHVAPDARSRCR